ncbi:MAG: SDR family oxidoreductase [Azospirillum sp.]|nr:SDR family oxidoreductase [Azospirillum sp.]
MGVLAGRKAIVTGGAQGIGAAIVRGLLAAGSKVAIIDRQIEKAQALADDLADGLGDGACAIGADLGSPAECRSAVVCARDTMGGLDLLVNNAAPGRNRAMIGRIADADWSEHESIVLHATANMVEAALADLAASGQGAVVNVSSVVAGAVALEQCSVPYHVCKAGLDQFTRWLAVRCGGAGVRVNAVAPGLVNRDDGPKLTDNPTNRRIVEAVVPLRRAAASREIAEVVIFLASNAASYVTGQVLVVDGGLGVNEVFGASLRAFNAAGEVGGR